MTNKLEEILQTKQKEVEQLIKDKDLFEEILNKKTRNFHIFRDALKVAGVSVIAEIKRKSPSKGELAKIEDPTALAHKYSKAGAAAISVLTDKEYFSGHLNDLKNVVKTLDSLHPCPVLRKDFIIHPYQIAESKKAGASAILLIVKALKDRLKEFIDLAHFIGLDALVEIHDDDELKIALNAGAQIIGVNSRNLETFEVSLDTAMQLAPKIPKGIVKIAESGISSIESVHQMHQAGFDGVLIGEMLVKADDPREILSEIGNV